MLTEDFDDFFDVEDFAVTATYLTSPVVGIFLNEYVLVNNVESRNPIFACAEADVPGVANGSTITINSTGYTVIEPQPDGTGIVRLILNES